MTSRGHTPALRIAVTTGDSDGIGLEVTLKALLKIRAPKNCFFSLFRAPHTKATPKYLQALESRAIKKYGDRLSLVISSSTPDVWVKTAAQLCFQKKIDAMVTAPMSKFQSRDLSSSVIGHTEILRAVASGAPIYMGFLGKYFNVLLATGHVSLNNVSLALTEDQLWGAVVAANHLRQLLSVKNRGLSIGLVGLNPHAGEGGLIGNEELALFSKVLSRAKTAHIPLSGPLVPDAAFSKPYWRKYSIYVCPYHDQGLIPFKMIHGYDGGAQISVGLPFIRTSVDHGTAKQMFGKNVAKFGSMNDALTLAISMIRGAKRGI